jgi:hypothetical protein
VLQEPTPDLTVLHVLLVPQDTIPMEVLVPVLSVLSASILPPSAAVTAVGAPQGHTAAQSEARSVPCAWREPLRTTRPLRALPVVLAMLHRREAVNVLHVLLGNTVKQFTKFIIIFFT